MKTRIAAVALFAMTAAAHGQSPGTLNLSGPSSGGSIITPATVNAAVNAALAAKADASNPVITGGTISGADVSGANVPATGGAQTPLSRWLNNQIWANTFGACTWDATHDVGPCVQAALSYAETLPHGGTVHVPSGTYGLATPLAITTSAVSLVTDQRGGILIQDVAPNVMSYGTSLTWIGAAGATMLTVAPPTNATTGQRLGGTNVEGIMFDCASVADTCIKIASVVDSKFDVGFAEPTGTGGVVLDTVSLGEVNDLQDDDMKFSGIVVNSATPGVVIQASGTSGVWNGNISISHIASIVVTHKNGDCLDVVRADHLVVDKLHCKRRTGGTGNTLVLYGNNTVGGAYDNVFGYVGGSGAIIAKGTSDYTNPSHDNIILDLDKSNNTPDPTVNTGASLYYMRDDGVSKGFGSLQSDFAPSPTAMTLLRAQTFADPLRVLSSANTGIALMANSGPSIFLLRTYIDPTTGTAIVLNAGNLSSFKLGGASMPLRYGAYSKAADPTTTDIESGFCADWNNTTAGTFKHVCNFGGVLKSVSMN